MMQSAARLGAYLNHGSSLTPGPTEHGQKAESHRNEATQNDGLGRAIDCFREGEELSRRFSRKDSRVGIVVCCFHRRVVP